MAEKSARGAMSVSVATSVRGERSATNVSLSAERGSKSPRAAGEESVCEEENRREDTVTDQDGFVQAIRNYLENGSYPPSWKKFSNKKRALRRSANQHYKVAMTVFVNLLNLV